MIRDKIKLFHYNYLSLLIISQSTIIFFVILLQYLNDGLG